MSGWDVPETRLTHMRVLGRDMSGAQLHLTSLPSIMTPALTNFLVSDVTSLLWNRLSIRRISLSWSTVSKNLVDGVKARELPVCPGEYWEQLREQILDRSYKPLPAKRTDIPKPDGSMRGLNVPAARDRGSSGLATFDFEAFTSSFSFFSR